jgi:hypothetical protein
MPNGGEHHCGFCCHFDLHQARCRLRDVPVVDIASTSCGNWDSPATEPMGPMYAILCEVKNRGGSYRTVPYWGTARPETIQDFATLDTHVVVRPGGQRMRFDTVSEYLEALKEAGLMPLH